jgi:hypothetical protein
VGIVECWAMQQAFTKEQSFHILFSEGTMNKTPEVAKNSPSMDVDPSAISILVDKDLPKPLGTGFHFLLTRFFFTAKPVIECRETGHLRRNLVLMQDGPNYPRCQSIFRYPSLDLVVLTVDRPRFGVPLYPSDQRLSGWHGLQYWGYVPALSDRRDHRYVVAVVNIPSYECEPPRERADGVEWMLRFDSDFSEGGHSEGPVVGAGGGVVAVITEGHAG